MRISDPPWQRFCDYLEKEFAFDVTPEALQKFQILLSQLKAYNAVHNLVSAHSDEELVLRHFADSLASLPLIRRCIQDTACADMRLADLGSGGGFPVLPLSIALPELTFASVESVAKKCAFQQQITQTLNLPVSVINERIEILGQSKEHRARYDMACSRALSALSPNLEYAMPLLKMGGCALIYKSEKYPEEIKSAENAANMLGAKLCEIFKYNLPLERETKHFAVLVYRKIKATPAQFPRKVGVPQKNPL
jgi:16S rRNA (guanine527-N7)-methyltransferase